MEIGHQKLRIAWNANARKDMEAETPPKSRGRCEMPPLGCCLRRYDNAPKKEGMRRRVFAEAKAAFRRPGFGAPDAKESDRPY